MRHGAQMRGKGLENERTIDHFLNNILTLIIYQIYIFDKQKKRIRCSVFSETYLESVNDNDN